MDRVLWPDVGRGSLYDTTFCTYENMENQQIHNSG